jgi:pSer/pThr/pTyr-binding forkhead associated (FHA) protein
VVLLIGFVYLGRRSPILRRLGLVGMLRRVPFLRPYFHDVYKVESQANRASSMKYRAGRYSSDVKSAGSGRKDKPQLAAFLEVLQASTQMPGRLDLENVEVKLGRSPSRADIAFKDDGTVSRVHATIVQEGAGYRIFDEKSTSGSYVNEQGVLEHGLQLVDGDEIRLGAVRLRFRQP